MAALNGATLVGDWNGSGAIGRMNTMVHEFGFRPTEGNVGDGGGEGVDGYIHNPHQEDVVSYSPSDIERLRLIEDAEHSRTRAREIENRTFRQDDGLALRTPPPPDWFWAPWRARTYVAATTASMAARVIRDNEDEACRLEAQRIREDARVAWSDPWPPWPLEWTVDRGTSNFIRTSHSPTAGVSSLQTGDLVRIGSQVHRVTGARASGITISPNPVNPYSITYNQYNSAPRLDNPVRYSNHGPQFTGARNRR